MKPLHIVAALIFAIACLPRATRAASNASSLTEIPAAPEHGFHYPYLLFVPKRVASQPAQYLLVEPNNTGHPDDNLDVHRAAALHTATESGVGTDMARRLGIPLLVPVFPRPKSIEDTYTHMLDRDTILISDGPLKRIDLQLLAMAEDAKRRLAELGRAVHSKVLVTGFSASGEFANRFTFLHPEVVAAAAYGGLNGFITVPVEEIRSQRLDFPLGLADYNEITGHPFDRATYSRIPQFGYMGEKDDNDAVLYDDAYSEHERSLVFELFGRKMMPDRWEAVQRVYREQNVSVQFRTYPGIGHGTNNEVHRDLEEFFRRAIESIGERPNQAMQPTAGRSVPNYCDNFNIQSAAMLALCQR